MTSTISSNKTKKPLLGMMLWSLKKALPITVIYSFFLFICFPMYTILSKKNSSVGEFDYIESQMIALGFVGWVITIATVVIAISMFSIYHKKRSMDFYASLPINKSTLFLAKYFSGLIVTIVPLAIFMILGFFAGGQLDSVNTFITFYRLLDYVVVIINIYSMLALLSIICGGKVDTLVTFGVINIAFIGLFLTGANLVASIVPGLFDMDYQIYQPFTFMLFFTFCPLAMPFVSDAFLSLNYADVEGKMVSYIDSDMLSAQNKILVIWFVLGVVYFVLAILVAKKRKNENVQNGFIFDFPKLIIQGIASLSAGMMLGSYIASYFCYYNSGFETMLLFVVGALLGSALSYLIVTLVYNKGLKRVTKGLPIFLGSFVVLVVFYLIISTGCVGVSSVPKAEDIKSVCVLGDNHYSFNSDVNPIIHSKGDKFEKANLFIEDKAVIKNAVALHQAIVDGLHDERGAFFNLNNNYVSSNGEAYEPYTIRIEYKLNNGKKITKTYSHSSFNYDKIKDEFNAVISSDVYKRNNYKLAKCDTALEANLYRIDFTSTERYTDVDTKNPESYIDINGVIVQEDKDYLEPVDICDSEAISHLYSTLREEFIADNNYAETLEAKRCQYVKPTESNSAIYDEIVFNINIGYTTKDAYYNVDSQAESLGVIPGEYVLDPTEMFVITKEAYPKTWELLNSYCVNENTNQVYMFPDSSVNS